MRSLKASERRVQSSARRTELTAAAKRGRARAVARRRRMEGRSMEEAMAMLEMAPSRPERAAEKSSILGSRSRTSRSAWRTGVKSMWPRA